MARSFRLYEKKRGNRSTGSKRVGSLGETLFFAAFFAAGCVGMTLIFVTLVVPEWRANHVFVEHHCTVLDKRVARREGGDGLRYRPEVRVQYEVDGERHVGWIYDVRGADSSDERAAQASLDQFIVGREYPCWYDPSDPGVAVLQRGYSWWFWLTFVLPVSFILTGGSGVLYSIFTWGSSRERRAALAKQAARLDPFLAGAHAGRGFPNVPNDAHISDSPGTTLAYRLPTARSHVWMVAVWFGASLVWASLLAPYVLIVVSSFLAGAPDWLMTAFLVPFLIIGVGLIALLFRQLVRMTRFGPTLLEISDLPLHPGEKYEVFLSQTGRLKMRSFELALVCDEKATYRHGTNTRTETHRVFRQSLFEGQGVEICYGVPFEVRCPLEVPAGAMHSFRSEHNEIAWKIVIKGKSSGRFGYERSFPVIVYPNGNGEGC